MISRLLLAALLFTAPQSLPGRAGMVNDYARVLTPTVVVDTEMSLSRLRRDDHVELVLVTLIEARGQDAEAVALRVRQEWAIGGADDGESWPGMVVTFIDQDGAIGVSYNDAARSWIPRGELRRIIDSVAVPALEKGDRSAALRDLMRALEKLFR